MWNKTKWTKSGETIITPAKTNWEQEPILEPSPDATLHRNQRRWIFGTKGGIPILSDY